MEMLAKIFKAIFGAIFPRKDADVYAILTTRAAGREHLDWRSSIVDLLKLLNLDSSMDARRDLAEEVGLDNYTGTAEQNRELHAKVMDKVRRREIG